MHARRTLLAAAALAAVALAATGSPAAEPAGGDGLCSMSWRPFPRDAASPHFLGVGTADSVEVPAPRDTTRYFSFRGSAADARQHGQVVEVGRTGGAGAEALERVFAARGSRRAIVVPWQITLACVPTPWPHGALFGGQGTTNVYTPTLRPRAEWVGGVPTFDAWDAEFQPYPGGQTLQVIFSRVQQPKLTAEEFFGFYSTLPVRGPRDARYAMTPELARWRDANPELARSFPAADVIRVLESAPPAAR